MVLFKVTLKREQDTIKVILQILLWKYGKKWSKIESAQSKYVRKGA